MAGTPTLYATSVDVNTIEFDGAQYKFSGKKYFIDGKWQWVFYRTDGNGRIYLREGILCDTLDLNELTTAKHFEINNKIYDLIPVLGNPPEPSSITPVNLSDELDFYVGSDLLRDGSGNVIYFMWADTIGQSLTQAEADGWKYFGLDNCPYWDGKHSEFTKYRNFLDTLEQTDDAASVLLGDDWCMPEEVEFQQLAKLIKSKEIRFDTTDNGIKLINPYTYEYILIPNTGYIDGGCQDSDLMFLWSSSLYEETKAWCCLIEKSGSVDSVSLERYFGVPVLPVKRKK